MKRQADPIPRRQFLRQAGAAAGACALASCGKAGSRLRNLLPSFRPQPVELVPFAVPASESIDLLSHALNRLTWGAAPGEYARLRGLGPTETEAFHAFVEEQLAPEKLDDGWTKAAVAPLEAIREETGELFEFKPSQLDEELTRHAVIRAVHSRRQLYEVMVAFWSDHFNIDSSKLDCRWFKTVDDRSVIRAHALGKFWDLLRASALSPAMLFYLDGRANRKRTPEEKPNENYARELLELHTLGVHGGYTQQDVMEAARCLTGWTVTGREVRSRIGVVRFDASAHDDGPKRVLGTEIPAGGGKADLDALLDIVSAHPSTAQFIATKLCRHFIADEPPSAAVQAVAAAFSASGGDIRQTLRVLFAAPEFAAQRGNRIKRPFHFVVSALRCTGATTTCGAGVKRALRIMGHAPFHYPTPEGPSPIGADWLSTLLHRWDFAVRLSAGTLKCSTVHPGKLQDCAGGAEGLLRHLFGRTPDATEMEAAAGSDSLLALALCSPAFQTF